MPKQELFSTREVAAKTGATFRKLQWWHEQGIIVATRVNGVQSGGSGISRQYTEKQIEKVKRLLYLRKHHVSVAQARTLLDRPEPLLVISRPTKIGGALVVPRGTWR